MVRIKLALLLAERKMHEFALNIKLEHIDKTCSALGCSVGDLIEYIPEEQRRKRGRPKKFES